MSVTMTRGDGVTVLTMTSDPQSSWPQLSSVFKTLCCSPVSCSVSQHLQRVQRTPQSALGALHIMVGLLNIGLGATLIASHSSTWELIDAVAFPYWLGVMFILFGTVSILSEKYPSPCLVIINVILNMAGAGFAIAATVLYGINIDHIWSWEICRNRNHSFWERIQKCYEGIALAHLLLRSISAVLIALSVLEFYVFIISAVLEIKALHNSVKRQNRAKFCFTPILV